MRTFLKQPERASSAAGKRGGRFLLVPVLLLCAWLMTVSAHAADSTYLFEVSTGANTGDESKISFFIITYELVNDAEGEKGHSKFLFPSKDAWTNTCDMANAASDEQKKLDQALRDTYGYSAMELNSAKKPIFQAYSTDQYLFTVPEEVRRITRVQVFAKDNGSWACRGMRVFRVDKLGGLYRWNTASSDCYIDFEGELIAEGATGLSQNISWSNDKLVSAKSVQATGADLALKNTGFDPGYAKHELRQDKTQKTLVLRLNFADTYGAGLEALSAMSSSSNKLGDMGLAETMSITLYYNDRYGMKRAAHIPAVLNAAEYAAGLLSAADKNKPIAGFAQQGEGMAVGIFLPDYASLSINDGISVKLGAAAAASDLKLSTVTGKLSAEAQRVRNERISVSETDSASFVTAAIYDLTRSSADGARAVNITAAVNEASGAIRYVYSGIPAFYKPVASTAGDPIGNSRENRISLTAYEDKKLLEPRDRTERYLIEITTDDVSGAGTQDDILMRINWTDLDGNAKDSGTLKIRELSQDFNGWWYGSTAKGAMEDAGYYKGVARGQKLRFFVSLSNVKEITNVEVWLGGKESHDDWQMKDLTISTVKSYDKRAVTWGAYTLNRGTSELTSGSAQSSGDTAVSYLSYDRAVESELKYRFTDKAANPALIQNGEEKPVDVGPGGQGGGGGADMTSRETLDWSQIRYSMTFQQASQNLGFLRQKYLYTVQVNVGGESDASAEDGDCGSKNLFYFRLIFQHGSSSFVLANQQLSSDGFIAGASQSFNIATNEDYGEVTAVEIIPEDMSENSDMFDKLMIKSIKIKQNGSGTLVPVWTVGTVGWISIDYRDDGQMQSITGMAGRGAEELTRTYAVDGSTYDVNLMVAIQTEGYPDGSEQFRGNLSATVYYEKHTVSSIKEEAISDVTQSIYSYINHTPIGTPESIGGKTISDPSIMFRPGHTDRFFLSLSDVKSIRRIEFEVTSEVDTVWKISNVSIFQVNGKGRLIINANDEYEMAYDKGEEPKWLASSDSDSAPAYRQILTHYDKNNNTNTARINVNFGENQIEINPDAQQWTSTVTRAPVSENDTFNVFIYPENGRADPVNAPVATLRYTDVEDKTMQSSTGDMSVGIAGAATPAVTDVSTGRLDTALYKGQEVFYRTNISAKNFAALNSVTIHSGRGTGLSGNVRAVVQRIRSGVVMNTWNLAGNGFTEPFGLELSEVAVSETQRQRVMLQLGADTEISVLASEDPKNPNRSRNDIAVALNYLGDDPTGMELRSPYIYLTDQNYTQIRPGQVVELEFGQMNVAEITGITLVSAGDVKAVVDRAYVTNERVAAKTGEAVETRGVYSFAERLELAGAPYRMYASGTQSVRQLSLKFSTASSAADDISTSAHGPVRMTLGYYDQNGDLVSTTYEDIRTYIADGAAGFTSGSTVNVRMLVPNVTELRWVELEPYGANAGNAAERRETWTLKTLTATLGANEFTKECEVNQQIVEGAPLRMSLADILMTADIYTGGEDDPQTVAGGSSTDLLIPSGSTVRIVPHVVGSFEGFTASIVKVDTTTGAVGRASFDDTRGYTEASIAAKVAAATDSREAAIWKSAKPETGSFNAEGNEISFLPPRNYTGASVKYQIRIVSRESASSALTVSITVASETDPIAQQLEELAKIIEAEKLEKMQQQINNLENSAGTTGGTGTSGGESGGADAGNGDGTGA